MAVEETGDRLGGAAGGDESEESAKPQAISPPPISEVIGQLFQLVKNRGKGEVGRAAVAGRRRLELRQLRRDRETMYRKLGREVRALVEGGELDHPGIARGLVRIEELDQRIEEALSNLAQETNPR